jgi:uncharacterized membrane protein
MRASASNNLIHAMKPASTAMNAARHFVVVKAPIDRVYEQWSRLEDLPKFITPLREVRRIDDTHFSYRWLPDGSDQQGVFHITLQIPGRRIAWRTLSNDFMSGVVSFEPYPQGNTEVTLKIRSIFDSPSLSHRVEEYLGNFKRLVENGHGIA